MSKKSEKLVLIDGMAMVYRAYFAMISHPLINKKGKNTSAVYGFTSSLVKILEEENPEHIAVCFDTAEPTFRHKKFPQYKAQRMEIPTDMPWQIDKVKEVVQAFNIPIVEIPGYEADDVIGTLVRQAEKAGATSYMVTPDKDYMQLVTKKTLMYKPARNSGGSKVKDVELIDENGVVEKFGVLPDKVIEILGLMGDSSDNIPGVKGVGEKTAMVLIQEYGSIDNLYKNIDNITKPKLKEKLITDKENALLSRMLATIVTDVPLKTHFDKLDKKEPDSKKLTELFDELEFKTLLKKFSGDPTSSGSGKKKTSAEGKKRPASVKKEPEIKVDIPEKKEKINTIKDIPHEYHTIKNETELKKLVKDLSGEPFITFDTETDALDPMNCNLVGLSFAVIENEAYYVPVHGTHKNNKSEATLFDEDSSKSKKPKIGIEINSAIKILKPLLENKKIGYIGQNIKYDYIVMKNYGVKIPYIYFDTLIGAFILSPEGKHNMDSLSEKFLNYKPVSIKELIGTGKSQITMDEVDVEIASEYASEDADVTLQLFHRVKYELEKFGVYKVCEDIEFPLIPVLAHMEFEGIKVDKKILNQIDTELVRLIKEYEEKIYKLAGEKFNINSTQQLAVILFDKLNLTPIRKTKTGYSTDVKVLEELQYQHEIASVIVDYRTLTKLKSTYIDGLSKAINPKTSRVHTSYSQSIAATGRLSSINPNLQNIPIRTEAGRSIRKAFVPKSKDFKIMSADYSQIELRIMAHYADDKNMINAFKKSRDIHTEAAMRVFKVKDKDVTPNMRRKAKEVNFGIIYGIGAFGLASRLNIKNSEAKEIIARYFGEFSKVRDYMERTKEFAREYGFVESITGRRRYLPQINNQNAAARAEDERAAINMPIQGTAADMIKIAMINIAKELKKNKMESKMLLQVHDELVFEAKKSELKKLEEIVIKNMKTAIKLNVPIEVEVGVGDNWFEAH